MADTDGLREPESPNRLSWANKSGTESLCAAIEHQATLIVAHWANVTWKASTWRTVHQTLCKYIFAEQIESAGFWMVKNIE